MNRSDFAEIFESHGFDRSTSKKIIDIFSMAVYENLMNNEPVSFRNIGTLRTVQRKSRKVRNLKTNEYFILGERRAVKFIPSKNLKMNLM